MLPPKGIKNYHTIKQTMEVIGLAHYIPPYLKLSAQEKAKCQPRNTTLIEMEAIKCYTSTLIIELNSSPSTDT